MLYIVSTPIGNLEDITLRAIETLKKVDYILAEDTRNSHVLLQYLDTRKKMISFHELNESKRQLDVLEDLKNGQSIALISDAGTPLISDPGYTLIKECIMQNIAFTAIPGPCSVVNALVLSGFNPTPFQFIGFLPKKESELTDCLENITHYQGSTIAFESPHRLCKTLQHIAKVAPDTRLAIVREMTKKFEEVRRDKAVDLLKNIPTSLKGEIVLVFEQTNTAPICSDELLYSRINQLIQECGLSKKEALQVVAKEFGISKNKLYTVMIDKQDIGSQQ